MKVKYDKVLDVMREDDLDGGTIAVDAEFTGNVIIGDAITDTLTINGQVKKIILDNDAWLQGLNNAEDANVNIIKVNTSDELDIGAILNTGPIELEEDAGAVTVINMPVSSTPSDGDEMSMSFAIDSNNILKVYGEADGSGGCNSFKVVVSDAVITGGGLQLNHQTLTAATLTLDANDGIVECDTTSNAIAITLPECSTVLGQVFTIYFETDNANDVVVTTTAGDTYAGVGDLGDNTATMADAGDFIVIQAVSNTRWAVIQNNGATLSSV